MNDLGNILDNIELDAKIKKLQAENKKLRDALKHYETGFKGACPTCEPVGELNLKLSEKLKIAIDALKNLIDKTEYGVNQWQKAWSPDKETEGQKAIKKARQALEKIKEL